MSRMKTIVALILGVFVAAPAIAARDDIAHTFATCAGRLSAEVEHAWLMSDPRADDLQAQRVQLQELVRAIAVRDRARHLFHAQIDAKMAHAVLLQAASFSGDTRHKQLAKRHAIVRLAACQGLLLDS